MTRERRSCVQRRTEIINRLKAHFAQIGEILPTTSVSTLKGRTFIREIGIKTPGVRGKALRSCLQEVEFQEAEIKVWEEEIAQLSKGIPAVQLLADEILGIGPILSATIVAEAGDIRRFRSAKAFGNASGLTPSERSTSGKTQHGGITRDGNPNLRWALPQAAMGCLRSKKGAGLAAGNWMRSKEK